MSEANRTCGDWGGSTLGFLGVAFVVLKLTGYIDWSWWWVTAPFWGGVAVLAVFFAFIGLLLSAAWCLDRLNQKGAE